MTGARLTEIDLPEFGMPEAVAGDPGRPSMPTGWNGSGRARPRTGTTRS